MHLKILPFTKKFSRSFEVPGSKSYTNRALLISALAKGKSVLYKPLISDDTRYMIKALRQLGVKIAVKKKSIEVWGNGGQFIKKPGKHIPKIYLGNAGTAVRFLTAALTLYPGQIEITGNERMQKRPIQDLVDALVQLGVKVHALKKNGCPPLITGGGLKGGNVAIKASDSSQFLSALLMVAPYAQKPVVIKVSKELTSRPYIDMTLSIMERFGAQVINKNYREFQVFYNYEPLKYTIEPDASSATYPYALAALHQSTVQIPNLDCDSQQADMFFLHVLKIMGCTVDIFRCLKVRGPKKLLPLGKIDLNRCPDAAMTVAILAALAKGKSTLTGLATLRLKETDRLHALAVELTKVGVKVVEKKDALIIDGNPETLHGATIETYDDHRMAMCFGILGTCVPGITILNAECVSKTYPTFWKDIQKLGIKTQKIASQKTNIILTGMKAAGKSSMGKELAKKLRYTFIDTDKVIEEQTGLTIPEIVTQKGWAYFRKLESELCEKLSHLTKTVIATGGGIMLNPKNQKLLKKNGVVIFLFCEMDELLKRLKKDYKRPSLTQQKTAKGELEQLWQERKDMYYQTADFCFDASSSTDTVKQKVQSLSKIHAENV